MTEQAEDWQVPDTTRTRARRRPESLVDYAVKAVRNELLTGLLRPGERLTEEATAQRLGISHIPVREAFRFLEAEGHVVRDARRGLRVAQLSAAEAQDIYRTRALLEVEANRLGVPELTPEDDRRLGTWPGRWRRPPPGMTSGPTAATTGPSISWPSNGRAGRG
jgi:DNA-binding GntR family transcriptional regulator